MPNDRRTVKVERITSPQDLQALQEKLRQGRDKDKVRIRICMTGCRAHGAEEILKAFREEVGRRKLNAEIVSTGCHDHICRQI